MDRNLGLSGGGLTLCGWMQSQVNVPKNIHVFSLDIFNQCSIFLELLTVFVHFLVEVCLVPGREGASDTCPILSRVWPEDQWFFHETSSHLWHIELQVVRNLEPELS